VHASVIYCQIGADFSKYIPRGFRIQQIRIERFAEINRQPFASRNYASARLDYLCN
jgi:hypothetical protein